MSLVGDIVGGIAGPVLGGLLGNDAADDAAEAQARGIESSNQLQREIFQQQRQDAMPAMQARNRSLEQLQKLLLDGGQYGKPIEVGDVTQEAGYQFGMQQGQNALNNQLAARGMRNSGAALKAAARYGNDYGTTKFNDAFNRNIANRSAVLNPLQSLAGLGQTGIAGLGQAGQNYANTVGNNALQLGNAQAAAGIAKANNTTNALNQLGGWYMDNQRKGSGADVLGSWGDWQMNFGG